MSQTASIVIVDYGMGNLRSVQKKFERLNATVHISSDSHLIADADKLVLPGVGHFANGIRKLKEGGIWDILNHKALVEKTPVLGICLGMQLMASYGEEGDTAGLGWFDADVVRFSIQNILTHKVPHIGWNTLETTQQSALFSKLPTESMFYFVHSYHILCREPQDVLATTTYDYPFASVIQKDNLYGTQFHPEKSHDWGEQMLTNFIAL